MTQEFADAGSIEVRQAFGHGQPAGRPRLSQQCPPMLGVRQSRVVDLAAPSGAPDTPRMACRALIKWRFTLPIRNGPWPVYPPRSYCIGSDVPSPVLEA